MRAFRLIACAALALPASACTIWYLATNPYASDAGADARADVVAVTLEPIKGGVGAIVAYGNTLYANVDGTLWSCADTDGCASFAPLVTVDASIAVPPGLAANDAGIFWVEGNGIWYASLDGGGAALVIHDVNNPNVLALDGLRLSWTTQRAGGYIVNSCKVARNGCAFDAGAGVPNQGTGAGGASQLVAADAGLDNSKLAAGSGFVVWVLQTAGSQPVYFTPVDGGPTTKLDPNSDNIFKKTSDTTLVTNDGPLVFFSFLNKSGSYVIEQVGYPDSTNTSVMPGGPITGMHSYALSASSGLVGYAIGQNGANTLGEDGGGGGQNINYKDTDAATTSSMAMTSNWIFILDVNGGLYKFPRTN